ncbi:MAG: NAD-dependent epimerase/dehydratase family protein [Myxococcota bacterium]
MAYEGLSVFSPTTITQSIVTASVTTFTAALRVGVKRVVYCSSMARYGASAIPFREHMQPAPRDPYGVGKVAGEELLKTLADAHGIEWVIAVPHNIIGARQKYDDPYRNVASIMTNLMLQGRQPYIYGDGTQMRCFSPVQDVVDCLAKLTLDEGMHGRTVNVGPDDGFITIVELAERIAALTNLERLAPVFMEARPSEVRLAHCSADLARELLGYTTTRTLDDGLADIVAYIRTRGVRPFTYHLPLEIENARTPKTWTKKLF